jgi:hypothetical protein
MNKEFRHRGSMLLNAVLALTIVVLAMRRWEATPASPDIQAPETTPQKTRVFLHPKLSRYPNAAPESDQRRWVVDQLRAMGVPNQILARMVQLNMDESCEERASEVWEQSKGDPAAMEALQMEIDMNRDAEMRAALGEDGFKQWDNANMMREANGGNVPLTPSESAAVYDLWKKLRARELELKQAKFKGEMDGAQADEAWEKADAEYKQQMKALLGDERYAKAEQMDEATAAASLRQDFAKANPSDAQFQELLKAQQQWNQRRTELDKQFQVDPSSPAYANQIEALEEARDQEYRRVLGSDAFDALQKQQDPTYSSMKKNAGIWGLDDSKIDYVYGTMKFYEKSVRDYQAQARAREAQGQNVDWDAVNKNLQQFAEQTRQALQSNLGNDSLDKLQRNSVIQFNQVQLPGGKQF